MIVWRIATENKKYSATDLSGGGSLRSPGRWNAPNYPILYTADTPALAMLETIAHIDANDLPQTKFLIRIDITPATWNQRQVLKHSKMPYTLPPNWNAIPHGLATVAIGTEWLINGNSLVLCVPSAITPEGTVVLINPLHPKANTLKATKIRPVDYKTVLRQTN